MDERPAMASGAVEAAQALFGSWRWLCDQLPSDAWSEPAGEALAAVTGLPAAGLNGVWCASANAHPAVLEGLLDRVASVGVPYCLQFPQDAHGLRALATARGMQRAHDVPLMRLDFPAIRIEDRPRHEAPRGLRLRRLEPEEAGLHAAVAAEGFGAPESVFAPLAAPQVARRRELGYYLGEVDGEPVVTGLGLALGGSVGVFDVATRPQYCRQGFGSALTMAILREAYAGGARWVWLQSSPPAHSVYRRLGFVDVAVWECWVTG